MISAWVDQDEIRRLADSLLSHPYGHDFNHLEVNFGSQFEGFAAGAPAQEQGLVGGAAVGSAVETVEAESRSKAVASPASPASPEVMPSPSKRLGPEAEPEGEGASEARPQPRFVKPSGLSPLVVRSAVQFLKKAQADGRAGGVIRESRSTPPALPTQLSLSSPNSGVAFTGPRKPDSRPIHSPFRRLSEAKEEVVSEEAPEEEPPIGPEEEVPAKKVLGAHLKRPRVPSAEDPILARVTQFGKWLKGPVGALNFFVVNSEGKILIDEVSNPKLIQVACSRAGTSSGSSEQAGSLHVRIGEDSFLEVIPTSTQFGILILGLITDSFLSEELISEITLGLEEVANARLIGAPERSH